MSEGIRVLLHAQTLDGFDGLPVCCSWSDGLCATAKKDYDNMTGLVSGKLRGAGESDGVSRFWATALLSVVRDAPTFVKRSGMVEHTHSQAKIDLSIINCRQSGPKQRRLLFRLLRWGKDVGEVKSFIFLCPQSKGCKFDLWFFDFLEVLLEFGFFPMRL